MGKLVYLMNVSLDGHVETPDHSLDWAGVDEEIHRWFNDRSRETDAFLYGRRLYEVMTAYWPTAESDPSATDYMVDFARIWNATPKIVFSTRLARVDGNSRLVSGDVGDVLARLRAEFSGELSVGGPTLAAQFIRRGLIDEYRVVVHPVILGAGRRRTADLRAATTRAGSTQPRSTSDDSGVPGANDKLDTGPRVDEAGSLDQAPRARHRDLLNPPELRQSISR